MGPDSFLDSEPMLIAVHLLTLIDGISIFCLFSFLDPLIDTHLLVFREIYI